MFILSKLFFNRKNMTDTTGLKIENSNMNFHIDWDTCFMLLALVISLRSKDPSTKVGSVIVDSKNRIVSLGYNGFPRGCSDHEYPWTKEPNKDNKYLYVVHSEQNAVSNSSKSLEGCKIYVTLFPCNKCSQVLIQEGVKEIVYLNNKSFENEIYKASLRMLKSSGVVIRPIGYNEFKKTVLNNVFNYIRGVL